MNFLDPELLRAAFEFGAIVLGICGSVFGLIRRDRARRDLEIAAIKKSIADEKERSSFAVAVLRKEFDDYKVHVAQTFATDESVARAVVPVAEAIDRLGKRIDELFTALMQQRPTTTRR